MLRMEQLKLVLTQTIPQYLTELELPSSWSGFLTYTVAQWKQLLPLVVAVLLPPILLLSFVLPLVSKGTDSNRTSSKIRQADAVANVEKDVRTQIALEEVEDICKNSEKGRVSFCRCWRSNKYPYCDGSHRECQGLGPLVITAKQGQST